MTEAETHRTVTPGVLISALIAGALLFFLSRINYLLFHSIAEIFSIVIASSVFLISWNARKQIENPFLVYLGIAYLFIGIIDLFHTLTYVGMNIFTDYDYYANQLWIGARYLESISLFMFFSFFGSKKRFSYRYVFLMYLGICVVVILSVLYWKIFPICFVEGQGLTPFKKISEYIISAILLGSIWLLYKKRDQFDPLIRRYLLWTLILTIFGELAFTFYISNYGLSNLVGHLLKIGSFYLVYKAIIETGIKRPLDLIFRELKQNQEDLQKSERNLRFINTALETEVAERKRAEAQVRENLKEKEILLQEIHHRVKNNMSVIVSLLDLQSKSTTNEASRQALIESQNRIHTMMLIHEKLYQSDNLAAIKVKDYFTELCEIIMQGFGAQHKVQVNIDIDDSMIDVKQASTLGLIVNELITNALKYAFPEKGNGRIDLSFTTNQQKETTLIVSDNGVGIPEDLDLDKGNSLGLKLVRSLAERQLQGAIDLSRQNGTQFIFHFKPLDR